MKTFLKLVAAGAIALGLAACNEYHSVPPNAIGMVLTPTGYDKKVQTPGQVNLGDTDSAGQGNQLVLIERSGIQEKESFAGSAASADKEDHRCLTADRAPVSIDVRMLFALPDHTTKQGQADLHRLMLLGRPKRAADQKRVMWITAASVYHDQAQQQTRGKIRQLCSQYKTFEDLLTAFADESEKGLTKRAERVIADSLAEAGVPMKLVNATVSNLKPDPTIMDATAAKLAAEKRVQAIRVITDFLAEDKSGARLKVYNMQVIQEIVAKAGTNGHNTIFMTDVGTDRGAVIPLPIK